MAREWVRRLVYKMSGGSRGKAQMGPLTELASLREHAGIGGDHDKHDYIHVTRSDLAALQKKQFRGHE